VLASRRIALAGAAALCLAAGVAVPALASSPGPVPAPPGIEGCPEGYGAQSGVACSVGPVGIVVRTEKGVYAGVRVGDLLCVKAEALNERTTADARVRVPCPVHHYPIFKDCDEALAAGASNIPASSPLYRKELDSDQDGKACETVPPVDNTPVKVAQPPKTVVSHLPVTH
jgi:hypothetical protein